MRGVMWQGMQKKLSRFEGSNETWKAGRLEAGVLEHQAPGQRNDMIGFMLAGCAQDHEEQMGRK